MGRPDFEELQVYKLSEKLANEIWKVVMGWDNFSKDTIGKQIVRSATNYQLPITKIMESPIERIKLSQAAKEQLLKLKRSTKIEQWNILCRWAFCRSLAEPAAPSPVPIPQDSNVEMTWRVFGGEIADILLLALKQRCYNDGLETDRETLITQFRLHLHRGIGYLAGDQNIKKVEDLIELATKKVRS